MIRELKHQPSLILIFHYNSIEQNQAPNRDQTSDQEAIMAKINRSLILLTVFLLAACSSSQKQTDYPATETDSATIPQSSVTEAPALPTETRVPTGTPVPTEETPEPVQPSPTAETIVSGDPFPLIAPGSEIDLKEIEMVTAEFGWGIAPDKENIYHILRTDDGGDDWREITPPQPLTPQSPWLYPAVNFSDPETGWASYGGTDLIWTTKDGGATWQPTRLQETALFGGMIHSLDNNSVWFFQFVDGGMQKVYTVLYRSGDGGTTWIKLLDPFSDSIIQSFDKTGVDFTSPEYGWLTRFFRGVTPRITLEITSDGGGTWESLEMPPPPSKTDLFSTCACGLYDPHLESNKSGSLRVTCECEPYDNPLIKSYLYKTNDGGSNWEIEYIPEGDLHFISPGNYYVISQEIYRTEDGGTNWDFVKTVYWDGELSFVNELTALGIARCLDDNETALVKTINGCQTFQLIEPRLLPSLTER